MHGSGTICRDDDLRASSPDLRFERRLVRAIRRRVVLDSHRARRFGSRAEHSEKDGESGRASRSDAVSTPRPHLVGARLLDRWTSASLRTAADRTEVRANEPENEIVIKHRPARHPLRDGYRPRCWNRPRDRLAARPRFDRPRARGGTRRGRRGRGARGADGDDSFGATERGGAGDRAPVSNHRAPSRARRRDSRSRDFAPP